uniref:Uncharacterized protein n=1 Tax=Rhipicephalus appendiculatus TaxID=34631 RepID=A0A131YFB8_RHIAP
MSSSKPVGGPRIRLEGGRGSAASIDGGYQEVAVRFMSPSNSTSYDSFATSHQPPVTYTAVMGPYGASVSASLDDGDREPEMKIVEECKGHTPLDNMGIKIRNKQPTIRLVKRCRGTPYGTQTGVIIDDDYSEDEESVQLSLDAPPGIRVIGRCTEHSGGGSYSYIEEQIGVPPAVGRSGRCRDHHAKRGSKGGSHSGGSERSGRLPAIAHVMGECRHYPDMSETEFSYEDDYQTCKMCVQMLHDKGRDGAAAGAGQVTPRLSRKSSIVHIYADGREGDGHGEVRLCEIRTRQASKKPSPGQTQAAPPPPAPPSHRDRKSRAPHKVPSASVMKVRRKMVSQPPPKTHSRPSSSPSRSPSSPTIPPSRPSSRQSSRRARSSSRSPSRPGSHPPSMTTTAKLEVEDESWGSSETSSIDIEVSEHWESGRRDKGDSGRHDKGGGRHREKGDTAREKRSSGRSMSKKPVAPTPPPEMRYAIQAKLALSKASLESVKRKSTEKVGGSLPHSAPTSAEMVMRAAWEQYYREYDRYKEEMAEWESVQRKMRKQLARFMSGPSKPPAPPPGVRETTPVPSKSALALAHDPHSTSMSTGGSNPNPDEGMHIRIGLPGRMVKGRRSRSFSVGRPIEDAPPCVQAMYAHPGAFGPPGIFGSQPPTGGPPPPFGPPPPQQFPPFGRPPGPPFGPFGRPRMPMLMPPPSQFGPPGPFGPQLEYSGMRPPRRSMSHIRLNFM